MNRKQRALEIRFENLDELTLDELDECISGFQEFHATSLEDKPGLADVCATIITVLKNEHSRRND